MSSHEEDLDLLLSLQDRVLETPPGSPSNLHSDLPGFLLDDESPRRRGQAQADLSVFRDAVQDCLNVVPKPGRKPEKLKQSRNSNDAHVEKYSGLRIRNQLVSPSELTQRLSDIRFIRLPAIKNQLVGDTITGCWATVGVLTEKGNQRATSAGKGYGIWKFGCLDENTISVFLFNDAYQQNHTERAGTVFALFNCNVRKDNMGGFSLSVYSANQILKIGDSMDYGVCKGKKKDGMPCTLAINKQKGIYCKFHKSKELERFSTVRTELKGGNLRTAFREPLNKKGIYIIDPDRSTTRKPAQPAKILSVDALKKALRNGEKVTTNTYSQGLRFLNEMTGKVKPTNKVSATPDREKLGSDKSRKSVEPLEVTKRKKTEQAQPPRAEARQGMGKLIELDIFGSDDEI